MIFLIIILLIPIIIPNQAIEIDINNDIQIYIIYEYIKSNDIGLLKAAIISYYVVTYANMYNLNPFWITSIIEHESNFNIIIIGRTNDFGLMQITKPALEEFNKYNKTNYILYDMFNPSTNIQIGCWYLRQMLNITKKYHIAIARYNAGKYYKTHGLKYYNSVKFKNKKLKEYNYEILRY